MKSSDIHITGLVCAAAKSAKPLLAMAVVFLFLSSLTKPMRAQAGDVLSAAAGDLDPTFGNGGKVTTDFFGLDDFARALVLQPDGKIVVAGNAGSTLGQSTRTNFALARYSADGSLDASFGSGGKLLTGNEGRAAALAIQPDGRLVAAGGVPVVDWDIGVARLNPDGSPDTSFGSSGGKVSTDFGGNEEARAVAMQADGKIVAAGFSESLDGATDNLVLVRYNSNGSLDMSFGSGGKVASNVLIEGHAIAIQGDGKTVVAGFAANGASSIFAVVRYNSDGGLDTGFGAGGKATADFLASSFAEAVVLQPDGKIVAAGIAVASDRRTSRLALARYNSNGSADAAFGSGGKVTTDLLGADGASAIALQPDGKILVAGQARNTAADVNDFGLVRFNSDGSLDASFGSGGKVITDFSGHDDFAAAVAIQADGKIVAAGGARTSSSSESRDFALARYVIATRPDFGLSLNATPLTAFRGTKVRVAVNIDRFGGFAGSVTITPSDTSVLNIRVIPDSVSTTDAKASFKLKIKGNAPTGPQTLVFTGKDDTGRTRSAVLTLVIE